MQLQQTQTDIKSGEFNFDMAAVKRVCEKAGVEREYTYIWSKLSHRTRTQLALVEPSKKALRAGHKAAFQFVRGLELTGENVDLISKCFDMMSAKIQSKVMHAMGPGLSERQSRRNKLVALLKYDPEISRRINEACLTPEGKWKALPCTVDDDYT